MTTTGFFQDKTRGPTIFKDPDSTLDYTFDWNDWLDDGQTILSANATPEPNGVTKDQPEQISNGLVTVRVSGGLVGNVHGLTCRITTNNGQVDERTIYFEIIER